MGASGFAGFGFLFHRIPTICQPAAASLFNPGLDGNKGFLKNVLLGANIDGAGEGVIGEFPKILRVTLQQISFKLSKSSSICRKADDLESSSLRRGT